jgi:hypothetical protein
MRSGWRTSVSLLAAAAVGAAVAIAVDRLVVQPDAEAEARAQANEVVLTGSDVGTDWVTDASTDLDAGAEDLGLLGGCANRDAVAVPKGQGSFTALSNQAADVVTSEVRLFDSSVDAGMLFDAAVSPAAVECVRQRLEVETLEQYGPGVVVSAVIDPISAAPGVQQSLGYRVRIDVNGVPAERVDVYLLRQERAVAALQLFDPGEPLPLDTVLRSIATMTQGLVDGL